ncbi:MULTISPECIES: hypothetical protein [Haloarcula]|uniref:hypothetical protein n=1 Tax=Haloarcula TaxID=2237 RepID=UPI0023E82F2F|nr:hypothetical protein [Halomicroarcula sp. SHR3]
MLTATALPFPVSAARRPRSATSAVRAEQMLGERTGECDAGLDGEWAVAASVVSVHESYSASSSKTWMYGQVRS